MFLEILIKEISGVSLNPEPTKQLLQNKIRAAHKAINIKELFCSISFCSFTITTVDLYQQILHLFSDTSEETFNRTALAVFKYQSIQNPIYRRFLKLLDCDTSQISSYRDIPLLPVSTFKSQVLKSDEWSSEKIFKSSGTMLDGRRSSHHLKSSEWYNSISARIFQESVGQLEGFKILGLLPSYIENGDSSLVHMVSSFQKRSETADPAFFLYDHKALFECINDYINQGKKVILFGVSFALVDFAVAYNLESELLTVIYTGGMKNRAKEMDNEELRKSLKSAFPKSRIISEYGMTEMLSQAYSEENGVFTPSPTMRLLTKELQDPFKNRNYGKTGVGGIIDLGNIDTICFILTEDLAVLNRDRTFEIIGRLSESDLRGCNLLYEPNS